MTNEVPKWVSEGEEHRPWGSYEILLEAKTYKVKRIKVKQGKRLSYQSHTSRSEYWTVVQGKAKVTLDGVDINYVKNQVVEIPVGTKHRVENAGHEELIFIEVQTGTYFGEDDIVRYEDDFGREGTN